jgi:hypothetical protein
MKRNVAIGVAAGIVAVVAIGMIAKKTGLLQKLSRGISDLADEVEDRFASFDKGGMKDVIPKGEDKNVPRVAGRA